MAEDVKCDHCHGEGVVVVGQGVLRCGKCKGKGLLVRKNSNG